ncbi:unnamed protein product, partial [Gemmata obscuriglobus UQM 2246]
MFDFAFGFLDRCETWSPVSFGQLKQPLLADQPLCKVMCHGTTRHPNGFGHYSAVLERICEYRPAGRW